MSLPIALELRDRDGRVDHPGEAHGVEQRLHPAQRGHTLLDGRRLRAEPVGGVRVGVGVGEHGGGEGFGVRLVVQELQRLEAGALRVGVGVDQPRDHEPVEVLLDGARQRGGTHLVHSPDDRDPPVGDQHRLGVRAFRVHRTDRGDDDACGVVGDRGHAVVPLGTVVRGWWCALAREPSVPPSSARLISRRVSAA
ncbi:hypothetical protein [Promicromonospora soli]